MAAQEGSGSFAAEVALRPPALDALFVKPLAKRADLGERFFVLFPEFFVQI